MMVTSWHPCLVKAPRICQPAMISTTVIISQPTLLWLPTNGDSHPPHLKCCAFLLVSQTLLHRAMLNNERVYPEPREFKPERFLKNGNLDTSVRDPMEIAFGFGRRWALLSLSIVHVSLFNVRAITVLVEFAPENISLIQPSHLLLRPFCQLLTW